MRRAVLLLLVLLISHRVEALPRYAIEEGVRCSSCHVNRTGGGMRNDTGGTLFTRDLVLKATQGLAPKEVGGRLNRFFAVGTDIRSQNATTFTSPVQNSFSVPQASFYGEFTPVKYVAGYVDYDLANTVSREAFLLIRELPYDLYVKAGQINLPYGLRIDDDSSPIRTNFNVTFANQDIGGEIGISPGPFEFEVALSNGVPGGVGDENLAKAVTTSAAWVGESGRVGGSFQWNRRTANELFSAGLHGGFRFWRFVWLGEVDLQQIDSRTGGGTTRLVAGYGELNWRVIQGFYAKAVYDYLDPDIDVADNLQHRVGLGIDLYPLPFSQISLLYRVGVGTGAAADDRLFARFHFFF